RRCRPSPGFRTPARSSPSRRFETRVPVGRMCHSLIASRLRSAQGQPGAIRMLRPVVIATILAAMGLPAHAMDYDVGSIHIAQPWTRATPKGAKSAGGYLKVTNKGTEPDRLTCVSLAAAAKCSIHEMSMERGVMRMRMLPDGLEVKPGETVELKPDSFHIMF